MKGQIAVEQRKRLVRRLEAHENGALNRLAHAVEARHVQVHALNYSRMHHKHNKSLSNRGKFAPDRIG